jgi:hypothetical protein
MPFSGRCEGEPTGARNCTWSFEDAGFVSLEEIEATRPGGDNCCPSDRCTAFWDNQFDDGATSDRVRSILDALEQKYPDMPRELGQGPCDFQREKWYPDGGDEWPRTDPWAPPDAEGGGEDDAHIGHIVVASDEEGAVDPGEPEGLPFEPVEETGDLPEDELPWIGADADGDSKYDCNDGLADWEDEWIMSKALWCCKHEKLGCLDEFVLRKLTSSQRVQS